MPRVRLIVDGEDVGTWICDEYAILEMPEKHRSLEIMLEPYFNVWVNRLNAEGEIISSNRV